ncbi:MAG: S-formylglutathione hydrolase [Pseudomonas marincola]
MTLETIAAQKSFGGTQGVYSHASEVTSTAMELSVFMPSRSKTEPVPVLYYLSGLTCTQDNVTTKGGFQRIAEDLGIAIVCPDTSPRGTDYPGENDAYDFGSGAGFYLNATEAPWSGSYKMYDYVVSELPTLIGDNFNIDTANAGIFGHSMGGHGALTIALRNPGAYKSVSAFAPICAPTQCEWGQKIFSGYLGENAENWQQYDATELVKSGNSFAGEILIDQGLADPFLKDQLKPELFEQACKSAGQAVTVRRQDGYDHSYYLMATFMEDHLRHHGRALGVA